MPVIARFCGITIKMYFRQSEHNPPHIHATYANYTGLFDIKKGDMFEGDIPPKIQQMIKSFIELHQLQLLEMWDSQIFKTLDFVP